jgi:hypothetical protein
MVKQFLEYDFKVSIVFFINGDARVYYRLSKISKQMVQLVVHYLKKYLITLSAFDEKVLEIFL